MTNKRTLSQIGERLLYLTAAAFSPNIPLFFLFSRNKAQGLLFRHFLYLGGALAVLSLVLYLLISKFLLRRRRAVLLITISWGVFWFFKPLGGFITRGGANFSQMRAGAYLIAVIFIIGFVMRYIKINRLVVNTIAVMLCALFVFNFIPETVSVSAGERQRAANTASGELPYTIKTEFITDPNLPHPNIYWLHMDGMMGFDAVERYFNDPQTELKNALAERGFIVNDGARLEGGATAIAVPALTFPAFYDSFLADEFIRVAQLTRNPRVNSISVSMREKGFSLSDINPQNELLRALSVAGYINISNSAHILESTDLDIQLSGRNVITGLDIKREADVEFNRISDFINLITDASALTVIKPFTEKYIERIKPVSDTRQIPEYRETVDRYILGYSDSDGNLSTMIRALKYGAVAKQHLGKKKKRVRKRLAFVV